MIQAIIGMFLIAAALGIIFWLLLRHESNSIRKEYDGKFKRLGEELDKIFGPAEAVAVCADDPPPGDSKTEVPASAAGNPMNLGEGKKVNNPVGSDKPKRKYRKHRKNKRKKEGSHA